ncbi:GNAT family N-acetyltransferase [Bifidobacterium polysaccharolyticum]|uniref:GNAT family N-acetyltransferase n=1 Tax=Bifidobacterium polysaccharolyticum TaxID=2750967 RepID=UPI0018DE645F|nr:GNAT family N-acetyltransferase [Bifidobacterium polysaccharolyticum]MBI0063599.1 GNAT family N-acetyltransferase [Bifidobacterium polysaccharolyticum]
MIFKKMAHLTQANADQIARKWHYSGQYSFYDMENDLEDLEEIITPKLRGDKYYQVVDDQDELVGYFCLERLSEEKVEVGLGLRPDLTGHGLGLNFVKGIEEFIQNNFNYRIIVLSVASFNKRAIKVYQGAGFKITGSKRQKSNDGVYEFLNLSKTMNR